MKHISTKFVLVFGILALIVSAFLLYRTWSVTQKHMERLMVGQAEMALEFDLAIRDYIAEHVRPEMHKRVGEDEFFPETMSTSFVARSVFDKVRKRFPDYVIKFSSRNPHNPANKAGPEEERIIDYFTENPQENRWEGRIQMGGKEYVAHFSARRMEESCLRCHGDPKDAPVSLVERYGPEAGFHLSIGDVALDTIAIPTSQVGATLNREASVQVMAVSAILLLLFTALALAFRFTVTSRLAIITSHFQGAFATEHVQPPPPIEVKGQDEIAVLATSYNALLERYRKLYESLEDQVEARTAELNAEMEERLRAEAELNESRRMLRLVLDTIPVGVFWKDRKMRYLGCNLTFARAAGFDSPEDVIGKTDFDLPWCDQAPLFREYDRQIIEMGARRVDYEEAFTGSEGKTRHVRTTKIGLTGPNDETIGVLACFQDVTEEKSCQDAIRDSEERFRTIGNSALDAIIMMDDQGKAEYWNPAAERMFGYTSAEMIGQSIHDHVTPSKYHDAFKQNFPAFRQSGTGPAVGRVLELSALRRDGSEFPIEIALSSMRVHGAWRAVATIRDITERKRSEEQLRSAMQSAQTAARAKSEFLANMSHEIRTPMNGIIGMNALLLGTGLDPEQQTYAHNVATSAESLLNIINEILDFSKIEAGKLDFETIDFDIRTALETLHDGLSVRAHDKGLEYVAVTGPAVPARLSGDPGRLRQVLSNLVDNAIKFTADGEIVVRVALDDEDAQHATLRFTVADTGIGIPPERQQALFEPFTQADASTTRKYGGTGLGLTICRRLVHMMDGEIGVSSADGQGATFWFTARLKKAAEQEDLHPHHQPIPSLEKAHILAVDDNATNRFFLQEQLRAWGCNYAVAPSGPDALERLRGAAKTDTPFDIAILDMQMPDMDGEMLAKEIRNDSALDSTLLVMMTSMGSRGDAIRFEEAGFAAYLTKPIKPAQLHECLAMLISRTGAPPAIKRAPIITQHSLAEESRKHARVLLAEDNPTNQLVALKLLDKLGYRAEAVTNGSEALRALERNDYDLVLMDLQMPELDGFEAVRAIRNPQSNVRDHNIPVIALTAHAMKGDREKCLKAGMNDYVAKPVTPKALAEALERQLPNESAPQDSRSPRTKPEDRVFDHRGTLARLDGDEGLLSEVLVIFLGDAPGTLKTISEALSAHDWEKARRQSHSLKGSAGNVGAVHVQRLALQLEEACDIGSQIEAERIVGLAEQALNHFREVVDQLDAGAT